MKALILTINDNILNGLQANACGDFLCNKLFNKGIEFAGNIVIENNRTIILNTLNNLEADINTIIILGETDLALNKTVKENLCEYLKDDLIHNEFAENAINNYYKNNNLPVKKISLNEALLPRDSKAIENSL